MVTGMGLPKNGEMLENMDKALTYSRDYLFSGSFIKRARKV